MPKTSRKSKKTKIVKTYNLRSRTKKLEEVASVEKYDSVAEPLQLSEVPTSEEREFITQPLQLHEVTMMIQSGLLYMYSDETDNSVAQRETAGSPIQDVADRIYKNALRSHFERKNINSSLPDEEELSTAWEDITNIKVDMILEYSDEVLDDLLDEEEAKNAASSKFFKARYTTPRVTKKRTNLNKAIQM